MSALSAKIPAIAAVAICAVLCDASADPVSWNDGEWDDSGAPNGKLLSDNPGWWGRSVFTGVTYSYEKEPANPKDVLQGDKDAFGRRLLDGRTDGDWSVPVGKAGKDPIAAVFDFKRPCSFTEVDVFASRSPAAHIVIETSPDGATWGPAGSYQSTKARTRIKLGACAAGRYLRLSFKASRGVSYLDEVLVWGDGEVSERYPENIKPIQRSGFLRMADGLGGNIRVVPLRDPTACSKTTVGMPPFELRADEASGREIVMARNETETRYFAVVNDTGDTVRLPISATGFGDDVKPEIRIGGVVRTKPPPRKLTAKQLFDLKVTGTEPPDTFGADEFPLRTSLESISRILNRCRASLTRLKSRLATAPSSCCGSRRRVRRPGGAMEHCRRAALDAMCRCASWTRRCRTRRRGYSSGVRAPGSSRSRAGAGSSTMRDR